MAHEAIAASSFDDGRAEALRRLIERTAADEALIVERGETRAAAELPSVHGVPFAVRSDRVRLALDWLWRNLRTCRLPDEDEEAIPHREYGEERAEQGVSVADVLQSYRIAHDVIRKRARDLAPPGRDHDAVLLEFLELLSAWLDRGMVAAAAGHRQAELKIMRATQHRRTDVVRRILLGGVPSGELQGLVEASGLDPGRTYHAVRARPGDDVDADAIERCLLGDETRPSAQRRGLTALVDGDVCGLVAVLPAGEAPVAVGVSRAVTIQALPHAFRQATRALETAAAARRTGIFDLAALGMQPAVLADHDVGDALVERYLAPLEQAGRSSGAAILQTVERYVESNGRLDVTARALWVHINTVRYRLARFEELTGRSLRDTETLVELWWALERRRLTSSPVPVEPASSRPAAKRRERVPGLR